MHALLSKTKKKKKIRRRPENISNSVLTELLAYSNNNTTLPLNAIADIIGGFSGHLFCQTYYKVVLYKLILDCSPFIWKECTCTKCLGQLRFFFAR